MSRELIMQDNTHGYTDFHKETPSVDAGITKAEVVKESYVIDYTSATFDPLTMDEVGGFNYRYVYGLDKLSVKITSEGTNWWGQNTTTHILKDYYHQDRLGSTTNMTDVYGRVVGRADYNEWGQITYKDALDITSSYRRIYPQLNYTGHDWDDVLGMYYAKARFYSADDKRFVAMDPVKGNITDPLSMVSYLYCVDNPQKYVDPNGEIFTLVTGAIGAVLGAVVGGVKAAVTSYNETKTINLGNVAKSAAVGALVGGAIGLTAGAAATVAVGATATATLSTASALSTTAVVGGSKALAGAALGITVYGSVAAGERSALKNGKLEAEDYRYIAGKALVGELDGATFGSLSAGATALAGAKTLKQAGKALLKTALSNPLQTAKVGLATANQVMSARSVDAAVERDDPLGMVSGLMTYGAGFPVLTCSIDQAAQDLQETVNTMRTQLVVADESFLTADGDIDWDNHAPNNGAIPGSEEKITLQPGETIDRYGSTDGSYTSPVGTPFEERSLPYVENPDAYHQYQVLKPIPGVEQSVIAPAFDQPGLGIQYRLPATVHTLLDEGYLTMLR